MASVLAAEAHAVLYQVVSGNPRVPGVVALATNREGSIYEGAAGVRSLNTDQAMTTDTVFAIFSTTKALTGTACLQLVEDGRLDLDAPARDYAPDIGELQVLEGFDADGDPMLRPPRRDVTTRMLLLHTAGLAYAFCNEQYHRLAEDHGQPSVATSSKASIMTPLLFDPGDDWEYGSNIDWAGQVVEGICGKRLGEVMHDRILAPLGMDSTAFTLDADMRSRMAHIHQRSDDGSLEPLDYELPADPELHMGGHGLYSTAEDYCRFIRMWLNDGMGPDGRVLGKDTVEMAAQSGLGDMKIRGLPGVIPTLSNYAEFFPGMPKSWGLTFMINDEDAPTGRPAGSLAWAGLANLYYWIDRASGVGGFWATQVYPFADPTSLGGYLDFETAVYDNL
ncbi:MAG: serine hydrolase [bacterium]|nr:serine hydrolase [bacterium]